MISEEMPIPLRGVRFWAMSAMHLKPPVTLAASLGIFPGLRAWYIADADEEGGLCCCGAQREKGGGWGMPQGTVKWFNEDKGYGFITPDDDGEDLFVHHTGIAGSGFKSLEEGASVSYEVTQGRKGMQAVNVSKGSTDRAASRDTEDFLRVPLEVEDAARILTEHFDPDDLYWAMVEAARRRG
jgi:cold shock protein